jgi:hypothetical protein
MTTLKSRVLRPVSVLVLAVGALLAAGPAAAGQLRQGGTAAAAPATLQGGQVVVVREQDARGTLQALSTLMRRYPPALGKVLRLDPSLLNNQAYLTPYPELAQFLAQHPEVAHNPSYFLQNVDISAEEAAPRSLEYQMRMEAISSWRNVFESFTIVMVVGSIAFAIYSLLRIVMNHRRWLRSSRIQAEAHNKLLDRLTSNDELVAYIQSPSGERFLQSAPITVDSDRALSAPLGRILWSVQAGLVLMAGGFGLEWVSGHVAVTDQDVTQPLYVIGVIAVSLGVGFVVSSVVAYMLSRRLGLLDANGASGAKMAEPPASRHV